MVSKIKLILHVWSESSKKLRLDTSPGNSKALDDLDSDLDSKDGNIPSDLDSKLVDLNSDLALEDSGGGAELSTEVNCDLNHESECTSVQSAGKDEEDFLSVAPDLSSNLGVEVKASDSTVNHDISVESGGTDVPQDPSS